MSCAVEYGASESDLRLAVLQALATGGPSPIGALAAHLGRDRRDVEPVVQAFVSDGHAEWDPDIADPHEAGIWLAITGEGLRVLEQRTFRSNSSIASENFTADGATRHSTVGCSRSRTVPDRARHCGRW